MDFQSVSRTGTEPDTETGSEIQTETGRKEANDNGVEWCGMDPERGIGLDVECILRLVTHDIPIKHRNETAMRANKKTNKHVPRHDMG